MPPNWSRSAPKFPDHPIAHCDDLLASSAPPAREYRWVGIAAAILETGKPRACAVCHGHCGVSLTRHRHGPGVPSLAGHRGGQRALPGDVTSLGVYRYWRDLGYAIGALMFGMAAAPPGVVWSVHVAGLLTRLPGMILGS